MKVVIKTVSEGGLSAERKKEADILKLDKGSLRQQKIAASILSDSRKVPESMIYMSGRWYPNWGRIPHNWAGYQVMPYKEFKRRVVISSKKA